MSTDEDESSSGEEPTVEIGQPEDSESTATKKPEKVYKDDEELDDTIFIRNVARFDTTQESLKAHMESNWGETVYCLLCKDRETGESKGTAFVKFKEPESAGECLGDFEDREMQQKFFLDGRNLFVLPALNRNQMGEVKRASAKKEEAPKEKKVKKARWYRTPVQGKESAEGKPQQRGPHGGKKDLKLDKRSKGNQMAGRDKGAAKTGRRPASKGGRGKSGKAGGGGKPEVRQANNKGRPTPKKNMKPNKKGAKRGPGGSERKMKKTKKVKRKPTAG